MFLQRFLIVAPMAALGLAGCGDATTSSSAGAASSSSSASTSSSTSNSSSSSAATGTSGASAVCVAITSKVKAVPGAPTALPTTAADLPAFAAWLDKLVPLAKEQLTELAATSDGGPILPQAEKFNQAISDAATSAHGTDLADFQAKFAAFQAAGKDFQTAATAANLPGCSH